jgi:hypothetical protein
MTRMMQSDIDSPCSRTFCSHFHVSASTGICQLPFGKRRPVCSKGNSAAIRARHSSLISISGIALGRSRRGWCWPRAAIARPDTISQLNRSNLFAVVTTKPPRTGQCRAAAISGNARATIGQDATMRNKANRGHRSARGAPPSRTPPFFAGAQIGAWTIVGRSQLASAWMPAMPLCLQHGASTAPACPLGIKSAVSAVGQTLPVFPN